MPLIDLDVLVPEDITFKFRGTDYVLPGDAPVDDVFAFLQLFQELDSGPDNLQDTYRQITTRLLALFQVRNPAVESLPFGFNAYAVVLKTLLDTFGIEAVADPTPRPKPKPRAKPRSRRSSGS